MIERANTVLVFDLDDTLYKEVEYVKSGLAFLARQLQELGLASNEQSTFIRGLNPRSGDFLQTIVSHLNLPPSCVESLLWAYRLHDPQISMDALDRDWLDRVVDSFHAIVILTDGRLVTQKKKIMALGLDAWPNYISELYQSEKPDEKRFALIERRWPRKSYVYLADNAEKDFVAPNMLGWITVELENNGENITATRRNTSTDIRSASYLPKYCVKRLSELDLIIRK